MTEAYALIHYQPVRYSIAGVENMRKSDALKSLVVMQLKQGLTDAGVRFAEARGIFRLWGRGCFQVKVGRVGYILQNGSPRWAVHSYTLRANDSLLVIRMQPGNESIRDFLFLRKVPRTTWGFVLGGGQPERSGTIHKSVDEVIAAIIAKPNPTDGTSSKRRAGRRTPAKK